MKRKFGKFLSLMLVLAMLLAMVPAVLAADTTKTFTAAMGVGDEIVFPRAGDVTVGTLGEKTTWSLTTGRYGQRLCCAPVFLGRNERPDGQKGHRLHHADPDG